VTESRLTQAGFSLANLSSLTVGSAECGARAPHRHNIYAFDARAFQRLSLGEILDHAGVIIRRPWDMVFMRLGVVVLISLIIFGL
jgi:hypothetical protein